MEMSGRLHAPATLSPKYPLNWKSGGPHAITDDSAAKALHKVSKDMQEKTERSKIISFFTKSSVTLSAMHSNSFDHPDNFQPRTPASFQ
jgi:hypothetical protein